ncbi:anthranilate phosphoribosyltransferase, partial [Pseudoalteromonas undina]
MSTQTLETINVQYAIEKLIQGKSLNYAQTNALFNQIMQGNMREIELTALLISLKMKGRVSDEKAGAAPS